MKKLLILFLILFSVASVSYSKPLKAKIIINSIDIISPDGEKSNYVDANKVSNIPYSSKIITNGMLILDFNSVDIILKNQQGLFYTKNPITKELIFSKVENTMEGNITINFNNTTIATIPPDSVFSLIYSDKDNSVTMKMIFGKSTIKIGNETIELATDETFKHICNKKEEVKNAI